MRRRTLCSALLLPVALVTAAGAQAPPQSGVNSVYDRPVGQSEATAASSDDSAYSTGWGVIWYVRGVNAQDPGTWVEGGAEGSALLLDKDPVRGETKWILLHGRSLFLGPLGGPFETVLAQPGEYALSRRYLSYDTNAIPANKRTLSEHLLELYQRTRIIHTPFLVGKNWNASAAGNPGATPDEADALLAAMNLRLVATGNRLGAAIWQSPAGGTPLRAGDAVIVQFDGSTPMVHPLSGAVDEPSADDPPIALCPDPKTYESAVDILSSHRSHPEARACRDGRDVFWRLPPHMTGKTLTVQRAAGTYDDFTLSAWIFNANGVLDGPVVDANGKPVCNASGPRIQFVVPAGRVYVAADLPPTKLSGSVSVVFESDCTGGAKQSGSP